MTAVDWRYLPGFRRKHAVRMTGLGYERSYCGWAPRPDEEWLPDDHRLPACRRCLDALAHVAPGLATLDDPAGLG